MKTGLLFIAILSTMIGWSQITITETDFPVPADTAMISQSDETSLDLLNTGANASWDFSWINISAQAIDTFHSVQNASILYQLIFNNSWDNPDHVSDYYTPWFGGALSQLGQFGLGIEEPVQFTAVHPDKVVNTGIGFEVMGTGIPGKSDTIDVQYELPMNYSDSWVSNSYTNIDLNPTFDAIYRRYQYRNSIVDGWGTITTPFGTFDALRVKSLVSAVDSFYLGFTSTWIELPTPDQVEYQWFTNGQKVPIFEVTTTDLGGNETITGIRFKDKFRTFASTETYEFDGRLFPNPVESELNIIFNVIPNQLEIYDMQGRLVHAEIPTESSLVIDTEEWLPGMYVLQLTEDQKVSTSKFTVK